MSVGVEADLDNLVQVDHDSGGGPAPQFPIPNSDNNNENDHFERESQLDVLLNNSLLADVHIDNFSRPGKSDTKDNVVRKSSQILRLLAAGTGFMADAYDLFVISTVMLILSNIYAESAVYASLIASGALAGAIAGQLFWGKLCDVFGRKAISIVLAVLIIGGCIASSLTFDGMFGVSIFVWLAIVRFVLGFGIGGEYPLSASLSSESVTHTQSRGRQVAMVFSMQGIGALLSALVSTGLLILLPESRLDLVWRLALAFGAIPSFAAFLLRIMMEETEQFKRKQSKQTQTKGTFRNNVESLKLICRYWRELLGTAGSWFLFDIVFYANGLFAPTLASITRLSGGVTVREQLIRSTTLTVCICLMMLPGYWCSVVFMDKLGRKTIQAVGFAMMALLYVLIGSFWTNLVKMPVLFSFLYGLSFFWSNFGPNTTTFVLPGESFPTKIRATCVGIAAASGKLGAVVGAALMDPVMRLQGIPLALTLCGCVSIVGLLVTSQITNDHSKQELPEEDKDSCLDMDTPGA